MADWPNTGAIPLLGCMDVFNPLNCPVAATFIEFGVENPPNPAVAEVPNGLLLPVGVPSELLTVFQPGLEVLGDPNWKLLVGVFEDRVFVRVVDNC